jgi:hypothetical protein
MKATTEQRDKVARAILPIDSAELRAHYVAQIEKGVVINNRRFRWDVYWLATGQMFAHERPAFFAITENLNDKTMDTLLRSIVPDLLTDCDLCGESKESSTVEGGLCASCFSAMPEGRWVLAGRASKGVRS